MFWNAECLPSDVRESNFILLLSTAGCWKQWPFSCCSQPWFCLLFQSLPLFYSTGTERAEPSHRTILPPAQCCKQSLCHVLDFFHKEKKKNTYKKQSNFSKQSKHAAHDWLHLAQEKICPSSRPSAPTEIPTSLSAQGHQTVLGLTHFS